MALGGRGARSLAHRAGRGLAAGAGALVLAAAGCSDEATTVTPVIDIPVDDPDATALGLDDITLTVAHAGSDREVASHTFVRGEALELPGVPFGDDLVIHMSGFVGASSVAYNRTCAFNVASGAPPESPHLFFSRNVKFANMGVAPVVRTGGLGIAYQGTALLVGGMSGADAVDQVERFDPRTGQLSTIGAVAPREHAVQALIGSAPQRVVVVGGASGADGAKFIEVLDGRSVDRFDVSAIARVDLTATAVTDGRVIVAGGNAPGQPPVAEIDEVTQTDATVDVRRLSAVLAFPRSGHTATLLGDDVGAPVLIAGGIDAANLPVAQAELFKPLSSELADPTKFMPMMVVPRHGHVAALMPDGSVLFIAGLDAQGNPVPTLERFSLDGGFSVVGDLPAGAGLVDFTATTLPDGRILLTGGRRSAGSTPLNNAYVIRLNALDGTVDVVATDHMAVARAGHQATLLCDGTVLISGGAPVQLPAERYNPPPLGRR